MVYTKKSVIRKKPAVKRLRKRDWSASIGGFGMRAGFSYKSKRSLPGVITDTIRKNLETPYHYVHGEKQIVCLHNTWYTLNLLSPITKGDNNDNRSGDIIHIDCIKFRNLQLNNSTSDNDLIFRFLVVKIRDQVGPTDGSWGSGLGTPDLFLNAPTNPVLAGLIDSKKVTVLHDELIKVRKQMAANIISPNQQFHLKLDQKYLYETGTVHGKNNNIYCLVMASQYGAVQGTTTVGTFVMSADIIFKNCK